MTQREEFAKVYPQQHAMLVMYENNSPAVSALDCIDGRHKWACWQAAWQAAQAAQPVHSGWKPIASAPKDGADVLLFCDRVHIGDYLPGVYEWNAGAWWIEGGQITGNPTHWMPLPPPPIHDTKEQAC